MAAAAEPGGRSAGLGSAQPQMNCPCSSEFSSMVEKAMPGQLEEEREVKNMKSEMKGRGSIVYTIKLSKSGVQLSKFLEPPAQQAMKEREH